MGKWSELKAAEKARVIQFAIQNGVSDVKTIRDTYNIYAAVDSSKTNFAQRIRDINRESIPDWESNKSATHKLSVGTDESGNHYIFPEVQEVDGKLVDFTRPPYSRYAGMESAEQRGDTIHVPDIKSGVFFTEHYKELYPGFKNGGKIHIAPSKRGTFTAAATKHGKSVQAFASQVLAHKENYSPAMVRKANFARNAAHWHDGNSGTSFLNMQPSTPLERMNAFIKQQQLQKALRQQAEKVQAQRDAEMQRRMLVKEENPGLQSVSLLSAFTPLGDVEQVGLAAEDAKQGNYGQAALGLGMLVLPNFLAKAIRARRISNALNKELKSNPLSQVVSDDMMDAWLAERWYKNETHSLPPRKVERFNVDPDDFGKDGIPLDYRLENNFPTTRKSPENVLIHVDNRIPIQAKREGFAPIPGHTEDAPAIWWQRNYPYYTSPTSLTAVGGHTLKVKEGNVRALEPTRRYEGAPGPVVVTEGILPYEAIESGIKINPEQTWFEREIFQRSPKELDYLKGKYLPEWFTFATGGPLYPFSFKPVPVVRY